MIKKKLGVFIAPALVLGLAACNNDTDTAFDNRNGNRINPTTNVDNDLYRVNNRYPFDHQGPLAEDYNNNDNNRNGRNLHEGRLNRNGQNNGNDNRARLMRNTNNNGGENVNDRNNRYPFDHQGPLTEDYNNNRNDLNDRNNGDRTTLRNRVQNNMNVTNRGNNNFNPNISNYQTDKNSTNYPHTKAVLIQEAKYQFLLVFLLVFQTQQIKV